MNDTCKNIDVNGAKLQFNKFDISKMKEHAAIAMIAKRGSGKSWICRDILFIKKSIPGGVIIAPTEKLNSFYETHFPHSFIHHKYDTAIVSRIFQRQSNIKKLNKDRLAAGKKPIDTRAFLLMDDCLSSKGAWLKDSNILEIFMNGRHYDLMYMLTMQFPLGIPPELRSNFDYIFILGEDFISNQKRIYEHYAGMFPTFELFQKCFMNITDDYGCMVINNCVKSKKIQDKVFWYRAGNRENFKFGSNSFKQFHDDNFDRNYNNKISLFDVNTVCSKKKNGFNNVVIEKLH
jgi:hypothetical protein